MKTSSLYIASLEPNSGSLVVVLGVMQLLKRSLKRVAFYRPIIRSSEKKDKDIEFVIDYFSLELEYNNSYSYTVNDIEKLYSQNRYDEILQSILKDFKQLQKEYDFVLCEGLNRAEFNAIFDFDVNLDIAKNLQVPFISVLNAKDKSARELFDIIKIEDDCVCESSCSLFGTFINRLSEDTYKELMHLKEQKLSAKPLFLIPEIIQLDKPTLYELGIYMNAKLLYGKEDDLNKIVNRAIVASMRVENYLDHIQDGDLIIVSGDRSDIILGSLAAIYSHEFAHISAIVLSGGIQPCENIAKMLDGLSEFMIPIFSVQSDTISTALMFESIRPRLHSRDENKISLALNAFNSHVDSSFFLDRITKISTNVMTPAMFEFSLYEQAILADKHIVLPESDDDRILQAVHILLLRGIKQLTLLGNEQNISAKAARLGLDISKANIIDPMSSELKKQFIDKFYEIRKHKGLHYNVAQDTMEKREYFATMMVYMGYADAMVSGAVTTTADTIRPALQIIKTKEGVDIVSSLFFMCLSDKVLIYADCAINQDPDADELAQIAITSAHSAKAFGIEPKVAMLSYSTGDSGKGADVNKVREATKIANEKAPELLIEGPLQYDAAIDKKVAKLKLPDSKVAGEANVLIFPDLNTGNNTYKAVQRSSNAIAIGPILQGLNKPVNDLSRGCNVKDIINTILITAIQASFQK
jgi:phosphate acetyltransferase